MYIHPYWPGVGSALTLGLEVVSPLFSLPFDMSFIVFFFTSPTMVFLFSLMQSLCVFCCIDHSRGAQPATSN